MGKGTLTIFSASAGSGKTYKLTGIYLTRLFESRHSYRRILAVTFTNKATAEMKFRILDNLNKIATGEKSDYLPDLIKATNKPEEWIRNEAKIILNAILHDYTRFSVSTIDSFFQKVLRAFTREIGLHTGFNIELDHSTILSSAVEEMIASSVNDSQLKNWLITYALANIDEEKSWNLKEGIINLAEELFKEKFRILSSDEKSNLENKEFLRIYITRIKLLKSDFENQLINFGKRAGKIYVDFELTDDMFFRKGQGVPKFIRVLSSGSVIEPNIYVREIMNSPPRWATGSVTPKLQSAISAGLDTILTDAINFYFKNISAYKTAEVVLSNIFALGILSDVLKNVHQITNSENVFLNSDCGELLNLITREDQSSFIYEKVGNRYENFMIDEFQDTSILQWNNFKTLIDNSMAEGFDNLVVGDVKQSIYRWRNSDWRILGSVLNSMVDNDRFISQPLKTNWRSRSNIIRFNNTLFSIIPGEVDKTLEGDSLTTSFKELYSEAKQLDPERNEGGFIRIEFVQDEGEMKWQDIVLNKLPGIIESVQDKGYTASDIGIIVRDNRQGAQVLKKLLEYSNNCTPERGKLYNFNVVSSDSLLLSNSPAICFITAVLKVVDNPSDMINKALMLRYFLLAKGDKEADTVNLNRDDFNEVSSLYFPEGYKSCLERIRQIPLFEGIEYIIQFFGLGDYHWNIAYLNTFQDYVVSFTGNKRSDIQSFLEWWETTGKSKSVVLPGNQDAMRILTIHKSKGLEFKILILPFLSWNLDHMAPKQPFLWVKPAIDPFNELGIVPIKYSGALKDTIFEEDYKEEKYSVFLDNINLLYVAMTRAIDAIYGFSVDNPKSASTIAAVLKNALTGHPTYYDQELLNLSALYDSGTGVFEYGNMPLNTDDHFEVLKSITSGYFVSQTLDSLKLKLHGENYFSSESVEVRKKINYGKLMHEVFEGINKSSDISSAIRKLVLEGKLPEDESSEMEERVNNLINMPGIAEWFLPDNQVITEAEILMPSGNTRRPDRVIFRDGKTTIIDFKFGAENKKYIEQIETYRHLLIDMGYKNTEAFIWYVDKNLIVSA